MRFDLTHSQILSAPNECGLWTIEAFFVFLANFSIERTEKPLRNWRRNITCSERNAHAVSLTLVLVWGLSFSNCIEKHHKHNIT